MAIAVLAPWCHPHVEDHHRGGGTGRSAGGKVVVGSYKMLKKIGQGGYDTVWKARHVESGDLVAIKSSLHGGDAAATALLLREAAMLAACAGNPAVVQIREVVRLRGSDDTDTDRHDHLCYLVMEYVHGQSLHDVVVGHRGQLSEPETRRAMAQLLAGVSCMHENGVVHRDLKPGNVLVAAEDGGRMKICDLGLATSSSMELTAGTPSYMAPELILGEKEQDCGGTPVDAWALGCIMAELVTGQPLFTTENLCEQLISIVDLLAIPDDISLLPLGVSAGPSKLRDRVPEELLSPAGFQVLQGLLEYSPKDRLTAVAALKMPWFAAQDDLDVAAETPT